MVERNATNQSRGVTTFARQFWARLFMKRKKGKKRKGAQGEEEAKRDSSKGPLDPSLGGANRKRPMPRNGRGRVLKKRGEGL